MIVDIKWYRKQICSKKMIYCEARNDAIVGGLSIRCPSAKLTKKAKKLPQTTKYVFTNTKKDDNISPQKHDCNLTMDQI